MFDLSLESSSSQEKLVARAKIPEDIRALLDRSIYLDWQVVHLEGYRGKPCCSKTHVDLSSSHWSRLWVEEAEEGEVSGPVVFFLRGYIITVGLSIKMVIRSWTREGEVLLTFSPLILAGLLYLPYSIKSISQPATIHSMWPGYFFLCHWNVANAWVVSLSSTRVDPLNADLLLTYRSLLGWEIV